MSYTKPPVLNAIRAMEEITNLKLEVADLKQMVDQLTKERTNLEIRCRILEERLSRKDG